MSRSSDTATVQRLYSEKEIMDGRKEQTVTALLLGDAGCGKSTFLSSLMSSHFPKAERAEGPATRPTPLLDSHQPFHYDIRFAKRSFTLDFYDTACQDQHWSTLKPDAVVLAFDISNRETLAGLKAWRNSITRNYQHGYGERIPVMMLGLKRDLRTDGEGVIYPEESYRIAQELRCDRYAECSAVTGELMAETFEDLARLAAMTISGGDGETISSSGCWIL